MKTTSQLMLQAVRRRWRDKTTAVVAVDALEEDGMSRWAALRRVARVRLEKRHAKAMIDAEAVLNATDPESITARHAIRFQAGIEHTSIVIELTRGWALPHIEGRSGWFRSLDTGREVYNPHNYRRKGGRCEYVRSDRRIVVGARHVLWLARVAFEQHTVWSHDIARLRVVNHDLHTEGL